MKKVDNSFWPTAEKIVSKWKQNDRVVGQLRAEINLYKGSKRDDFADHQFIKSVFEIFGEKSYD